MDREFYFYCPLVRAECKDGELTLGPSREDVFVCTFYDDEECSCEISDALTALRSLGEACNNDIGYLHICGSINTYEQNL